jgi:hypothetical protein
MPQRRSDSRRRFNFCEPMPGGEAIRVDWFTLRFEVTRVSHRRGQLISLPQSTVRRSSFSPREFLTTAIGQIPPREVSLKLTRELFVISISFRTFSFPLTSLSKVAEADFDYVSPWSSRCAIVPPIARPRRLAAQAVSVSDRTCGTKDTSTSQSTALLLTKTFCSVLGEGGSDHACPTNVPLEDAIGARNARDAADAGWILLRIC